MQTKYIDLDYQEITNLRELYLWAIHAFHIDTSVFGANKRVKSPQFAQALCQQIGCGQVNYVVREKNTSLKPASIYHELDSLNGWKHQLGFHLQKHYGVSVKFQSESTMPLFDHFGY